MKKTSYLKVYMCASKGPFGYLDASISQYSSHYEWRKTTGSNDNGL